MKSHVPLPYVDVENISMEIFTSRELSKAVNQDLKNIKIS